MQFSRADEEVDLALKADPNFVAALILKSRLARETHLDSRFCFVSGHDFSRAVKDEGD
jgi:hypothetical protein